MPKEKLKRTLGLLEAVMLGLGGTIGSGIFVLLGHAAGIAGPAVTISFIIGFLITLFTGLSYSELASSLPIAGGGYSFAREAIKGIGSFVTGWFMWFGNMVYCALSAIGFSYVVQQFIPIPTSLVAIPILAVFSALNLISSEETGRAQTILTLFLILLLSLFVIIGYGSVKPENLSPLMPKGAISVLYAAGYVYVCYIGFEIISTASEEIKDPGKNIPRAILLSMGISAILFVLISLVSVGVVHYTKLEEMASPIVDIGSLLLGYKGTILFSIAAMVATLTTLNASMVASGRVAYALSRDKYLPDSLSKIHTKYNTPYISILVSTAIICLFAATEIADLVAYLSDFGYLVGLTLINLSVIFLRRKRKKLKRPFKVPLYPLVPILGALTSVILLPTLSSQAIVVGVSWLLFGLLVYHLIMVGGKRIKVALGGMNLLMGVVFFIVLALSFYGLITLPEFIFPLDIMLTVLGLVFILSGILYTLI